MTELDHFKQRAYQLGKRTTREELLARIDNKSRLSSRASSRATSPKQLMKQLHEKLSEFELPLETPRGQYPEVQVFMAEIF